MKKIAKANAAQTKEVIDAARIQKILESVSKAYNAGDHYRVRDLLATVMNRLDKTALILPEGDVRDTFILSNYPAAITAAQAVGRHSDAAYMLCNARMTLTEGDILNVDHYPAAIAAAQAAGDHSTVRDMLWDAVPEDDVNNAFALNHYPTAIAAAQIAGYHEYVYDMLDNSAPHLPNGIYNISPTVTLVVGRNDIWSQPSVTFVAKVVMVDDKQYVQCDGSISRECVSFADFEKSVRAKHGKTSKTYNAVIKNTRRAIRDLEETIKTSVTPTPKIPAKKRKVTARASRPKAGS